MWQLHKSNTVCRGPSILWPHAVVIHIGRVQGDNLSMLKGCYHDRAAHAADMGCFLCTVLTARTPFRAEINVIECSSEQARSMDIRRNPNRMSVLEGLPVQSEDISTETIRADGKLWLLPLSVVLLENSRGTSFCSNSVLWPNTTNQNVSHGEGLPTLNMNKISVTA